MKNVVEYHLNKAAVPIIIEHLLNCNDDFIPPLSERVNINNYARKIKRRAIRFEAWSSERLIGFVAAYYNDSKTHIAFITTVSVLRERMGQGIAFNLLWQCIEYAHASGIERISLKVGCDNIAAIKLYKKVGFTMRDMNAQFVAMDLDLNNGEIHDK